MTTIQYATADPRPVPFPTIRRLSRKEVDDQHPRLRAQVESIARKGGEVAQIDGWVAGTLGLARGAVFVCKPEQTAPFLFNTRVNGHPTQAVVAREYGDVSWPAFLDRQRKTARAEAASIIHQGLADVTAWLRQREWENRITDTTDTDSEEEYDE